MMADTWSLTWLLEQQTGGGNRSKELPTTPVQASAPLQASTVSSAAPQAPRPQEFPIASQELRTTPSQESASAPAGNGPLSLAEASAPSPANPASSTAPQLPRPEESPVVAPVGATPQNFIVFLDDAPGAGGVSQRADALMNSLGITGSPVMVFQQLNGFVLNITEQQAQRLRALGGVRSVEADAAVFLGPPIPGAASATGLLQPAAINASALASYVNNSASTGETLPWGVRAVWQGNDISSRGNFAEDTFAFVIDSGVINSTGDLNLASTSSWHRSWISGETAFTDGNGHGTHVAGTIAALANGKGVVGVAPGAQVVSLKVFDSSGGGASYSTIIAAMDHAVGVINNNQLNKGKVVINMSLGGGFSSSLDTAVKNAANQGVRLAVAAGNDGQDADSYSPAAAGDHPNVFTVSAVDSQYRMASWSNWDRITSTDSVDDVDVAAPGVSVLSYNGSNGGLESWSGTSMATPHVAGLLLAGGVQTGDLVTPDYSGTADPFAWGVVAPSNPDEPPTTDPEPVPNLVLWGTTSSDVITGGNGNDRISGVLQTGTTAAAMGAKQIDVLTGGAGADVFILGDSRGVFYDDRQSGNLGTGDYARIKDFKPGEDKLQLRSGKYLFTTSNGNLSLYWDRNGNGSLNTSGSNRDELIAILEAVSGLASSDILYV